MTIELAIAIAWLISMPLFMLIVWFTGITWTEVFSAPTRLLQIVRGLAMLAMFVCAVAVMFTQPPYTFWSPGYWSVPFLASHWANLLYRLTHRLGPSPT